MGGNWSQDGKFAKKIIYDSPMLTLTDKFAVEDTKKGVAINDEFSRYGLIIPPTARSQNAL